MFSSTVAEKLTKGTHNISGIKLRVTVGQVPTPSQLQQAIPFPSAYSTAPQAMQPLPHVLPQQARQSVRPVPVPRPRTKMSPMSPVVRVVGILPGWDKELLSLAFDDEDEGGGEIEENGIHIKGNEALITFKDPDGKYIFLINRIWCSHQYAVAMHLFHSYNHSVCVCL